MKKKIFNLLAVFLLASTMLIACGGTTPATPVATVTPTERTIEMPTARIVDRAPIGVRNIHMPDENYPGIPKNWEIDHLQAGDQETNMTTGIYFVNGVGFICTRGGPYPGEGSDKKNCVLSFRGAHVMSFETGNAIEFEISYNGSTIWLWFNGATLSMRFLQ